MKDGLHELTWGLIEEIKGMGVVVNTQAGSRHDCIELSYDGVTEMFNLNDYNAAYQMKLILNSDVMSKRFR